MGGTSWLYISKVPFEKLAPAMKLTGPTWRALGAVALGSKMVDPPVVKQAFRTVELAIIAGDLEADWESSGGQA